MVNPNDIKQKSKDKLDFDLYRLTSTEMSVSICSADRSIVPAGLITEVNAAETKDPKTKEAFKSLNIDHYQKEFNKKQQELQNDSYNLVTISGFTLELLLGRKDTKKAKKYLMYDIYIIHFHLGNYGFNCEMTNLNYFVQMLSHLSDTMLTSHISDFRPLIKPITAKDADALKARMGSRFGPQEEELLKKMRHYIVRDYFRLLLFTNLYRKYGALASIDVKKRLIWTFKRSSVIYQLISGKTLKDIINEEDKFLRHEFKYLEKLSAIELNNKLLQGNIFEIEFTDEDIQKTKGLSSFQKLLIRVHKKFQNIFDFEIYTKVSFSMSLSLLKLGDMPTSTTDLHLPKPKYRLLKELDTNLNNCVLELRYPSGPLQGSCNFSIESIEVRFTEEKPNYERSIHFNQETIAEYIQTPTYSKRTYALCDILASLRSKTTSAIMAS